jgi:hypothetical protein
LLFVTASVLTASAPMRRKHSCPKTRCRIAQRVPNEAMPLVMLRLKFYIRHRRELRLKAPGDAILCLPLLLQVHLSKTSIPAKSSIFTTFSS